MSDHAALPLADFKYYSHSL